MYGYERHQVAQNRSSLTSATLLRTLQDHVHAWQNLKWLETRISIPRGFTYELSHGVYGIGSERSLTFIELPSRVRGTELHTWELKETAFDVKDFTMDPTQNLLALLTL